MRDRYWGLFILALINGFIWLGWNFAAFFAIWMFVFIAMAIKDKLMQRKAQSKPSIMSNMWVKMILFMIIAMVAAIMLIYFVIFPLIAAFECHCNPFTG
jgi:hypothetical protein